MMENLSYFSMYSGSVIHLFLSVFPRRGKGQEGLVEEKLTDGNREYCKREGMVTRCQGDQVKRVNFNCHSKLLHFFLISAAPSYYTEQKYKRNNVRFSKILLSYSSYKEISQ